MKLKLYIAHTEAGPVPAANAVAHAVACMHPRPATASQGTIRQLLPPANRRYVMVSHYTMLRVSRTILQKPAV